MHQRTVPSLPAGVTWLIDDMDRSVAPHQLVLGQLEADRGRVLWIDARDVASTYTLYPRATTSRLLESIRIARAWTAYQHQTLVRRAVERASNRTRLIVLPHICSLYRDDDIDDQEADRLLESSLQTLSALADALAIPVLLTAPPAERVALESTADYELRCERTDQGVAYVGEEFRTTIYPDQGWWQTTIPYWVELLGAIRRGEENPWMAAETLAGLETFA